MNEELEKLKLLAEKATPGPWRACTWDVMTQPHVHKDHPEETHCHGRRDLPITKEDAEFIAACDPSTVLDLLSQIEERQWKPISEEPTVDGWYLVWYENCAVAWERRDGRYWLRTVADNWAESARNGKCWKRINPPEETLS